MVLRNSKILEGRSRIDSVVFSLEQLIDDDSVAERAEAKVRRANAMLERFGVLDENRSCAAVASSGAEISVDDQVATVTGFQHLLFQRVQPLRPRVAITGCRNDRISLDSTFLAGKIVPQADLQSTRKPG